MKRIFTLLIFISLIGFIGCTTPPGEPGTTTTTTSTVPLEGTMYAVTGDWNPDRSGSVEVSEMIHGWDPDFVVTTGDNIQVPNPAVGTDKFDYATGQLYCDFMQGKTPGPFCPTGGTAAVNKFFPTTGNHDYSDGGIENYLNYFQVPKYYDVVLGDVHFFMIDSQGAKLDSDFLDEQRAWLETEVAASTAEWQVVLLHHPPFSSSATKGSDPKFQWDYDDVDLVLSGHAHLYERISNNNLTYVVNGLGGHGTHDFAWFPVSGSQVRYNDEYGAVQLIDSDDGLVLRFITVDGKIRDEKVL